MPWITVRVAVMSVVLAGSPPAASQERLTPECGRPFSGFDSRLAAELVAILPDDAKPAVGFEVTPAGPVVATPHRLYALREGSVVTIPIESEVSAVSVDARGRLALHLREGVSFVGSQGLEPIAPWARVIEGRLFNSGNKAFIEALVKDGATKFGARLPVDDRVLPIAELEGPLRAAHWHSGGLLAVVGNALVRWTPDRNLLERIAVDEGLEGATGVCSVGDGQALVALRSATLLFTGRALTVIAAVGGTCRPDGDSILLFDPRMRRIWRLQGLETVGGRERDVVHARRLAQLSVTQGVRFTDTPEFSEAVRLVGCKNARGMAVNLQK